MSTIVVGIGHSHQPRRPPDPKDDAAKQGHDAALRVARAEFEAARPDVLVIVGSQHMQGHMLEVMPPFMIATGECIGSGIDNTYKGEMPVDRDLAVAIGDGLTERDFDVAIALRTVVDHGVGSPYTHLAHRMGVPVVPVIVNATVPPLPSLRRSHALGAAIGDIIRTDGENKRVAVAASGGLSHWGPDFPRWFDGLGDEDKSLLTRFFPQGGYRSRLAVGRTAPPRSVMGPAEAVESPVDGTISTNHKRINPEFDARFLTALERGDLETILSITNEEIEEFAGLGGHEIRCWVIANAIVDGTVRTLDYVEMTEWHGGLAVAMFDPLVAR